jgi:hypothetical protein
MNRRVLLLALPISLSACIAPIAPAPAQPRQPTAVAASFGKTWDGVIDEFASRNIPIKAMDRASGFIATDALSASHSSRVRSAHTAMGQTLESADANDDDCASSGLAESHLVAAIKTAT